MKSIHVRDVEPAVLKRLQILARLHHRSMQGEIRAILTEASLRAPAEPFSEQLNLVTVDTGNASAFTRDEIYDDAR